MSDKLIREGLRTNDPMLVTLALMAEWDTMPRPCPKCGTPYIRHVGPRAKLKCECREVEAASGPEAVALWNEEVKP